MFFSSELGLDLSFFQKRDNLSKFTNACRSISIPDVLLITSSYFENRNKNLLVSGLVTFFIWVLNLCLCSLVFMSRGIPDTSKHVTISSVLKSSESSSVDTSISMLARRLSNRANGVVEDEKLYTVDNTSRPSEEDCNNKENEEVATQAQSALQQKEQITHTEELHSECNHEQINLPDELGYKQVEQPSVLNVRSSNSTQSVPYNQNQFFLPDDGVPLSMQSNSLSNDPQPLPSIQSWMNRNGVSPIIPEGDITEHTRTVEKKINRFISHVTGTSASTAPLVFCPESPLIEARPLLPSEPPQLIVSSVQPSTYSPPNNNQMVQRHRVLDQSNDVVTKRRNVEIKGTKATSYGLDNSSKAGNRKPVRYVRRLGRRRIVAGAICQSCFLDGLDENGEVVTSVQVRNVGWGTFKLKRRDPVNQGEEFEEPLRKTGGLFGEDTLEEREDDDIAQYYARDVDVTAMEQELDREIEQLRGQTLSYVCKTNIAHI